MEVEKRGVKGGFFQLFDWNGKSRKKLFSSKSELPESSNQGKENYNERYQQGLEKRFHASANHSEYHYASISVSGGSEYGTKAPGVVARLMGLDSMPMLNVNEPCLTPFLDSHSFRDSSYFPPLKSEHDIVIFESVRNKLDGLSRNPLDLRLQQKVQSRHLERFQREVLPPKSAKPINVTQHRLLSPIKSPGFVPPKNAAYIIEAAAKMIEQSPRSTAKVNSQSFGPSSIPFSIRELKEKTEAAQRPSRSVDGSSQKGKEVNSKNMKRQLNVRGQAPRSEEGYLYKVPEESKRAGSQRLKSKEKSGFHAVQAKTNIQKRDGSISVCNRGSEKQKVDNDIKSTSSSRNLAQKKVEKQTSSRKPSEVLRLNNQKQNCTFTETRENFEPPCSQPKERKESNLSTNYMNGRTNRTINKIVVNNVVTSKKTNFVASDPGKEFSSSRAKTISKKKHPINGNIQSGGSVAQKAALVKEEKSVKCNVAFEDDSKWDGIDRKNSLDVVSFTFSSPIKKSGGGLNSCSKIMDATSSSLSFINCDPCVNESDLNTATSSSEFSGAIGRDALSVLLEHKLKELTSRVELSQKDLSEESSFSSSNHLVKSLTMDADSSKSKEEIKDASDCSTVDKLFVEAEKENKGVDYIGKDSVSSNAEYLRYLDFQGSISVSSQPSSSGVCSDSFDVDRSSSNEEGMNWSSNRKCHIPAEGDMEISDTASSSVSETVTSTLYMTHSKDSSNWELQYIGDILSSAELLLEEFALGQSHKILAPDLFHHLENLKMDSYKADVEEQVVLERKVLFDCICECLEDRCSRILDGGCRFWAKQTIVMCRKQWLADDLYREILGLKNVEELMVDELVDKDMSSRNGKWVDFEIEAFEEGVEIEKRILTGLLDELVDDFLF